MFLRAFAVVSDETFFPGLWALLSSIYAYYGCEYRVYVMAHRLSPARIATLDKHPLSPALTILDTKCFAHPPVGTWEAKQSVFSELAGQVSTLCLLDADLVLLSRIDDVFEWADGGKIVSSQDGHDPVVFDEQFISYGDRLIGQSTPYFNSGFLCLSLIRHWDLVALWEFTGRFAGYSPCQGAPYTFLGHGDQGLLNAVAALLGKQSELHLLPQSTWCNSGGWTAKETVDIGETVDLQLIVTNRKEQVRQRLIHSTGPKWWTKEGAEFFRTSGDVLKCFEHFANLPPMPKVRSEESTHDAGDLRYIGDVSKQDAHILAINAAVSPRILEFGVGGSTQILAQVAPPGAVVTTVETDDFWISTTRRNLEKLNIHADVRFLTYGEWQNCDVGLIDLVFVDGRDDLRSEFARRAWKFLRVGGTMLFHDTRRSGDISYVLDLVRINHTEIDSIEVNVRASNITSIRKKIGEPYVNWNAAQALEDPQ